MRDPRGALNYVLLHDPEALPCFAALPPEMRTRILFTQADLGFDHGQLLQVEAPPGALLHTMRQVVLARGLTESDVAFYFVHWLTDLAGAEGAPLAGAEKFVIKFPHAVLNS